MSSGDEKRIRCTHVGLQTTATVTYVLDPDGPVTHKLEPLNVRLCALCAGWVYALLLRTEDKGPL